jgi:hypothetical protein
MAARFPAGHDRRENGDVMTSRIPTVAIAVVWAMVTACTEREAPRTPLGSAPAVTENQSPAPAIAGNAKRALDSANTLFRSRAYDQALAQYELSARLAPAEMAPLLGILMVADVKKDSNLKATAMLRVRKLDPTATDTSTVSPHRTIPAGHPPIDPAPSK